MSGWTNYTSKIIHRNRYNKINKGSRDLFYPNDVFKMAKKTKNPIISICNRVIIIESKVQSRLEQDLHGLSWVQVLLMLIITFGELVKC